MTRLLLCLGIFAIIGSTLAYENNWESLDSRPLPSWYDQAKIGIFIHWGVFSVPSFGSEWFWKNWATGSPKYTQFMNNNYRPDYTYADFAADFTAEFYEPNDWADLFEASGAKYVVLTSKHHEGYTLWPSKYSFSWNAMDVGPKRDLLGDLATSIRDRTSLRFGLYHSLYEWYNPLYLSDQESGLLNQDFVKAKTMPELYELVNTYQPDVIWSDGEWEAPDTYWTSTDFIAWLYNESPVKDTVVVNDRWGGNTLCKHGDFYTCADRFNPGVLQEHKWENCMTLDKASWGYRREAVIEDYLTMDDLIKEIAMTVSCGGNILINVGPTKEGTIVPIQAERLKSIGWWLQTNGEAIYESNPWTIQNDTLTPDVWYTEKDSTVYAILLDWPAGDEVTLGSVASTAESTFTMLGTQEQVQLVAKEKADGTVIALPKMSEVSSDWGWVIAMTGVTAN